MKRPPVAFRVIRNLYYIVVRSLIYPMYLLRKNFAGIVVMVLVLFVYVQCSGDDEEQKVVSPPAVAPNSAAKAPALTVEDGNSAFATDLLPNMQKEELTYYSQTFYWVMSHQKSGKAHTWQYATSRGSITPSEKFKNNVGHTCRKFKEELQVGSIKQTLDGIACRQYAGGWCKLRQTATPRCDMGAEGGIGGWWNRTQRGVKDLF